MVQELVPGEQAVRSSPEALLAGQARLWGQVWGVAWVCVLKMAESGQVLERTLGSETAVGDLSSLRELRDLELHLPCAQLWAQNRGCEQDRSWCPSPILCEIRGPSSSSVSRIASRPKGVSYARKSHHPDRLPSPAKSSLLVGVGLCLEFFHPPLTLP